MKLDMHLFAERLRTAREALGWNQTTLAHQAGLNLGNVNELEQCRKASVRADTLLALASTLGVSVDYLLGLTDEPHPRPRPRRPRQQEDTEASEPMATTQD